MREIKFRAWDKKRNCWNFTLFDFDCDGQMIQADWFEINQFTSLKDKNGKEIYEGDIVKWNDGYETKIYSVSWQGKLDYPGFDFDGWEGEMAGLCEAVCCPDIEIEVIGNIYENPELLK